MTAVLNGVAEIHPINPGASLATYFFTKEGLVDELESLATRCDLKLRRFLRKFERDPHLIEDLVQETFVEAIRSVGSYQGRSKPETWVPQLGYQGESFKTRLHADSTPGSFKPTVPVAGLGGNIALLATNRFILTLRALEARQHARVLSRPSVLTMDNVEAVLDLSHTSYIKLVGERSVDTKSISAGLMFQVTPRVMGASMIHLHVDVEDGEILSNGNSGTDALVSRKAISTQAVLGEQQVLVIGGYRHSRESNNRAQTPLLGDVPLLGKLFRSSTKEQNETERLYVISARPLVAGADMANVEDRLPAVAPLIVPTADSKNSEPTPAGITVFERQLDLSKGQ